MLAEFRLKVFESSARRLNFTLATEELFITQPIVTRHIRELERQLSHSRRILKKTTAESMNYLSGSASVIMIKSHCP